MAGYAGMLVPTWKEGVAEGKDAFRTATTAYVLTQETQENGV